MGPMGPRGLGPKTQKLSKSLKHMKIIVSFQHGKEAHRDSANVALNDSPRSLIWNFSEQIVFLEIGEKVSKVAKLVQFWVQAVCLTTRLPKVIGQLQTPGASPAACPPGVFFWQKRRSGNLIMRTYQKKCIYMFFLRKLI